MKNILKKKRRRQVPQHTTFPNQFICVFLSFRVIYGIFQVFVIIYLELKSASASEILNIYFLEPISFTLAYFHFAT